MKAAYTTPRGAVTRNLLNDLLLLAGPAGTQLSPLATRAGLCATSTLFHLHRMPNALQAKTAMKYRVLWFHRDFAADCAAYVERQNATARHRFGCSPKRVADGFAAIQAAGRNGATHADISQAAGLSEWAAHNITRRLRNEGRVVACKSVGDNGYTVLRFYLPELAPAEDQPRPPNPKRAKPSRATAAPMRASSGVGRHTAPDALPHPHDITPPAVSISSPDHGLALHPTARVTVDPRGNVNRWETDRPQFPPPDVPAPGFAQMRPGQYLEADTAIARRYA